MDLHAERRGERGETVLLVHYPNPEVKREDFEVDAVDVADLLASGGAACMRLVRHSHGGVISLLAAARRPPGMKPPPGALPPGALSGAPPGGP